MATFINVWRKLSDRKYRSSFAIAQFKRLVPFQIRALRKSRNWSQAELAEHSGLTQGVISRAEDSDNGNLAVNTILKIADGFDVAFVGRFVPYSELDEWFTEISEEKLRIPSFEEEDKLLKMRAVPFTRSESCDRPEHSNGQLTASIEMPKAVLPSVTAAAAGRSSLYALKALPDSKPQVANLLSMQPVESSSSEKIFKAVQSGNESSGSAPANTFKRYKAS